MPRQRKKIEVNLRTALEFGLMVLAGFIFFKNLEPYVRLIAPILTNPDGAVTRIFYSIPLLGGVFQSIGWLFGFLGAVLPCLLIVFLEILPSFFENERENIKNTIDSISAHSRSQLSESDDELQELRERYNRMPLETLKRFYTWRTIAYLIDAAIILWYYPPLIGGWSAARWGWPELGDIDFANLGITVAILFLFQLLVELVLWLRNVRKYLVIVEQNP